MSQLLDRYRQTLIIALSVLILLGSGISLGIGIIETQGMPQGDSGSHEGSGLAAIDSVAGGAEAQINYPIDLNSATKAQLEALPGIGATRAQAIVDYRASNGPFKMPAEIVNVPGIGPKTYEKIKSLITTK